LSGVSVRAVSLARNGERGVLAACPEWSVTRPQRNWLNGGCGLQSVVRLQVVMTKSGDCAVAQPEELLHRREGSGAGVKRVRAVDRAQTVARSASAGGWIGCTVI